MDGQAGSLRVEDLDLEGAYADEYVTARVGRVGGVAVLAVDHDQRRTCRSSFAST